MKHTAENFAHQHHEDWETGREDGSQFNPYSVPRERTGEALAAYLAGYEFGGECMAEYEKAYQRVTQALTEEKRTNGSVTGTHLMYLAYDAAGPEYISAAERALDDFLSDKE